MTICAIIYRLRHCVVLRHILLVSLPNSRLHSLATQRSFDHIVCPATVIVKSQFKNGSIQAFSLRCENNDDSITLLVHKPLEPIGTAFEPR
jgi:hypothetical protein